MSATTPSTAETAVPSTSAAESAAPDSPEGASPKGATTAGETAPATSPARVSAATLLAPGAEVSGFTVTRTETIPELDADAYVLRHQASGARLLYLACDDENKAFAIAFKTPPADDTGVFHILEHSVLCGSAKFPVKEPFVDLIKSSMQTFLNAMTYPDKTVYPVASTNEQDLLNLMDVYLDAVLNPAIYTKRAIFEQEGWHEEVERDATGTPRRRVNGVVYNEMKGALADPMDVLDNAVNRALFPDTAYAHESGGNPAAIPSLTYEGFLDTHARHYNLANSYIVLYGDFADVRRELAFMDKRYLSDGARAAEDAWRAAAGLDPQHVGAPNPLRHQDPVVCDHLRVEMETTPDNALVGAAYVLGEAADTFRTVAADVLFDALLGSNEAPVKRAILEAGIGGNVLSYTSSACLQPYELIMLQGAKPEMARTFAQVIEDTCRELVEQGVPRDRLEAVISSNEYTLRQRDYGTADGVVLACDALSTWLYAEDTPETHAATAALEYADIYARLRRELEGDFFENLLRELVLESSHRALVELVPVEGEAGAEVAADGAAPADAAAGEPLTPEEAARIEERVAELRAAQEAEDTPEAKATLPRLTVADIGAARPEPPLALDRNAPIPCLVHPLPTHALAYALTYFDLTHVSYAELPYVKVLCRLLQQLPTARHTAAELDSYITGNLGFLSFSTEVFQQANWRLARPVLCVAAGALSEKIDALASIPHEVWSETLFEDTERMRDVLVQLKIGMEQAFLTSGHQAALARSLSYVSPAAVVAEQLGGVDFYRFLTELVEHFDERTEDLCEKLHKLSGRIFTSTGTVASFTGSAEDYRRYWAAAGTLGLEPRTAPAKELYVPAPEPKHEAFVIPSDVCYAAQATDPRALDITTDGRWGVAAGALSYDYLWNEIRVKGGAYGCGFRAAVDRQLAFYTYRDPAIDPSLERIARAGAWLSSFEPDQPTFEGFLVASVASHDAPVKPYAQTKRRNAEYFAGREPGFRDQVRAEMLACTPVDLRSLGEDVTRVAAEAPMCVFGGRAIIEASQRDWNIVELMG